jgi:phosphoribosylanthranilate isomerase
VILAGGLDSGNVMRAVQAVRPYAVDVSSGVEEAPGIKSATRIKEFIDAVRRADRTIHGESK